MRGRPPYIPAYMGILWNHESTVRLAQPTGLCSNHGPTGCTTITGEQDELGNELSRAEKRGDELSQAQDGEQTPAHRELHGLNDSLAIAMR